MCGLDKIKKILGFVLKLALAGGIVTWLIMRDPREIIDGFRSFDYLWLLPALLFYLTHMLVCAWRWHRLTGLLGVKLSRFEALSLTMQGYFFSLVIPGGAIGGDVVKMGVLAKRTEEGGKVEGAFTILMDRIIGMIALFSLALLLLWPATGVLLKLEVPGIQIGEDLHWLFIAGVAGLCLAGLGASCVIFFHRQLEKIPPIGFLMRRGDRLTHGMVSRMTSATDIYSRSWPELTRLTVISIFGVHLMTVVPLIFLLHGLHVEHSIFTLVVAVTIGNIVGLIPIFPSGVGGRDVATIAILVAGGIPGGDAKTGMLLYTAIVLFFNLCGGFFFLFDPGRAQTKKMLEEAEDAK